MPQILDGVAVRNDILERLKPRIEKLKRKPGLAVVLVGHNPASEVYVRSKIKTCGEIGIFSDKLTPPETITTDEMLALTDDLNRRPDIGTAVEIVDQRQHFIGGDGFRRSELVTENANFAAGLDLAANVNFRSRIVAHQDNCQPR